MRNLVSAIVFVFISAFLLSENAQAQEIESGTWTGFVFPPNQDKMDVTFEVAVENDTLRITLFQEQIGFLELTDIELGDNGLNFSFQAGSFILCDLKLKANKGYEGECGPEGQEPGIMVMNPPKKESK
ncbi:MAG: hypothetical protein IH951_03675 [Bacteroidetes bacterium]|nr:hypothetical protein [Bacteroidota bacterium]